MVENLQCTYTNCEEMLDISYFVAFFSKIIPLKLSHSYMTTTSV